MKNRRGNIVVFKFLLVGMRWMFIVDICKGFFLLHVWLIHSFMMLNFKLFWQQFVFFISTFTSCLVHELTTAVWRSITTVRNWIAALLWHGARTNRNPLPLSMSTVQYVSNWAQGSILSNWIEISFRAIQIKLNKNITFQFQ